MIDTRIWIIEKNYKKFIQICQARCFRDWPQPQAFRHRFAMTLATEKACQTRDQVHSLAQVWRPFRCNGIARFVGDQRFPFGFFKKSIQGTFGTSCPSLAR